MTPYIILNYGITVADPALRWGGGKGLVGYMFLYAKGAKCLVMALCLGPLGAIDPMVSPGSATG